MVSFFAEVKIFRFWPKTMDYSPWFEFLESKNSLEKRKLSMEVRFSSSEYSDYNITCLHVHFTHKMAPWGSPEVQRKFKYYVMNSSVCKMKRPIIILRPPF